MARVPMRDVKRIDWNSPSSVIAMAKQLGPGMVVVKHDTRSNYNITHRSRRDLWDKPGVTLIHQT